MRILVWILLLGNVIFFAVMQWGGALFGDGQAVQAQPALHEEKIRLLDQPKSAPVPTQPVAASAVPVVLAPVPVKPNNTACMEWGEFSGADLTRAGSVLANLQLGDRLSQRQIERSIGYWVYIAPLKDKAAVNQKVAQLKGRGISEYFVVQDAGPWFNAISLGVFKTQDAAQKFTETLRAKDVHSAQVGERAGKFKATVFVLNGLDAATGGKLTALQKDFAGTELKTVPCH